MMRKLLVILAAALLLVGVFAMSAQAAIFDFNVFAPDTGTISYAGGATPLIGTNIEVAAVAVEGFGIFPVTDGLLNFTSGNFTGFDPAHWNFGPGGFLTISGTIAVNDEIVEIGKEATWVNVLVANPAAGANTFHTVVGEFVDSSFNADFLEAFGFAAGTLFPGNINLSFDTLAAIAPPNAFGSSAIGSGDVTQVPVPPSMVLLGSGLLGLVGFRFRKNRV